MSFWSTRTVIVLLIVLIGRSSSPSNSSERVRTALLMASHTRGMLHDIKAFSELFAANADWITVSGARVKGRTDIRSVLTKEHSTWARNTTMTATDIEVRPVQQDVAVVFFKSSSVSPTPRLNSRQSSGATP